MLPSIDGLKEELGQLRAIEQQLAEYGRLYADADELGIGSGPVVAFDAVEVRLTGVTQVTAVLNALLRSVEVKEAILSARLTRIERRANGKPATASNDVAGDQSDAVEP